MSIDEITQRRGALSPAKQALLDRLKRGGLAVAPAADAIRPRGGDHPAPLSPAQQRIWFRQQMEPESTVFTIAQTLRLRGAVDAGALDRAFVEIVRRHAILRSVYPLRDGEPVQVVGPAPDSLLRVEDATEPSGVDEARRRTDVEVRTLFDLANGPVIRARLLRLAADDHVLLLSMHHIVGDAWSLDILFRELSELYAARRGTRPCAAPLPVQYADYAAWQRNRMAGDGAGGQLAYWRRTLEGAPTLDAAHGPPAPRRAELRAAACVPFDIPAEVGAAVAELARRNGATTFMALLAAFYALPGAGPGQDDVVVGTPIAGRTPRRRRG